MVGEHLAQIVAGLPAELGAGPGAVGPAGFEIPRTALGHLVGNRAAHGLRRGVKHLQNGAADAGAQVVGPAGERADVGVPTYAPAATPPPDATPKATANEPTSQLQTRRTAEASDGQNRRRRYIGRVLDAQLSCFMSFLTYCVPDPVPLFGPAEVVACRPRGMIGLGDRRGCGGPGWRIGTVPELPTRTAGSVRDGCV